MNSCHSAAFPVAICAALFMPVFVLSVEIENFRIPNPPLFWEMSNLVVGPDGGVWFTCGTSPPQLMRADENGIEYVIERGLRAGYLIRLAFSPDGTLWLWQKTGTLLGDVRLYTYTEQDGLDVSEFEVPPGGSSSQAWSHEMFFDTDNRAYFRVEDTDMVYYKYSWLYELTAEGPVELYEELNGLINSPLLVTRHECLVGLNADYGWKTGLYQIDLETRRETLRCSTNKSWRDAEIYPAAVDSQGAIWFDWGPSIAYFEAQKLTELASGVEYQVTWGAPRLTADRTVWATKNVTEDAGGRDSVGRFSGGTRREFTQDDGLLTADYGETIIDYDGAVWVVNYRSFDVPALSRITDGGHPPLGLTLESIETPETVAIVGRVNNNEPVAVGVDVYVAVYLHGELLYYPRWSTEPQPIELNLNPGFNGTGTIIEADRSLIPPGAYTFYGAMTGRGTQKYIGPINDKIRSVTLQVD